MWQATNTLKKRVKRFHALNDAAEVLRYIKPPKYSWESKSEDVRPFRHIITYAETSGIPGVNQAGGYSRIWPDNIPFSKAMYILVEFGKVRAMMARPLFFTREELEAHHLAVVSHPSHVWNVNKDRTAVNDHDVRMNKRADKWAQAWGYKTRILTRPLYDHLVGMCRDKAQTFRLQSGTYHIITNFKDHAMSREGHHYRTMSRSQRRESQMMRWVRVFKDNVLVWEASGSGLYRNGANGFLGDWKKRMLKVALKHSGLWDYEDEKAYESDYLSAKNIAKAMREVYRNE